MNRPEGEQAPPGTDDGEEHAGQRVAQGGAERAASPGGRTDQGQDPRVDQGATGGDSSSDEQGEYGET